MVFSSHLFLFYYLPLILLLYYILPLPRYRTGLLAIASYGFYGWANPPWAVLMFVSTLVDYVCGVVLIKLADLRRLPDGDWPVIPPSQPRTRGMTIALIASIVSNLAILGFFKYYNFTAENLNRVALGLGLGPEWVPLLQVALPVGISFYTFKSMSYCIDVYRGDSRPMSNFMDFCCFEALFPDLVAGPIVRYGQIADQMRHRTHTAEKFARGIAFFSIGMAKKILIANPIGYVADAAFAAGGLSWYDAWVGIVGFAFQVYFDFSGYSDMAVGLALMLGFLLNPNFDAPYRADSITDFWRRWHISLSTWLRDYLYIPLGGSKYGNFRTYANLFIVMLLGGFWHGASWNYVIWGGLHGVMLAFERFQGKNSPYRRLPRPVRVAMTFALFCITLVVFRANTLPHAGAYLATMFGAATAPAGSAALGGVMYTPYHVVVFLIAALIIWTAPQTWALTRALTPVRAATCLALLALAIVFMWTQTENPFLYFQF
jgi:alginate O-acetyltransferase complex protein AlgI